MACICEPHSVVFPLDDYWNFFFFFFHDATTEW